MLSQIDLLKINIVSLIIQRPNLIRSRQRNAKKRSAKQKNIISIIGRNLPSAMSLTCKEVNAIPSRVDVTVKTLYQTLALVIILTTQAIAEVVVITEEVANSTGEIALTIEVVVMVLLEVDSMRTEAEIAFSVLRVLYYLIITTLKISETDMVMISNVRVTIIQLKK